MSVLGEIVFWIVCPWLMIAASIVDYVDSHTKNDN